MRGEEKGAIDGPAELPHRCTQSLAPRRTSRHVDGDGHIVVHEWERKIER